MNEAAGGLVGKRVLVARAEGQTERAARALSDLGAVPVVIPCIEVGPVEDDAALRRAVREARDADWIVFTSENGVAFTWRALAAEGLDGGAFGAARFAVVGAATLRALEARGQKADVMAKEFRGESLAEALLPRLEALAAPAKVVLFRAEEGSDVLPTALIEAGAAVDVVATYRTRTRNEGALEVRQVLVRQGLDAVVLSSGSIVESLWSALGTETAPLLGQVTVACIGPVTTSAAKARGIRVDVVPEESTFAGVARALERHFRAI